MVFCGVRIVMNSIFLFLFLLVSFSCTQVTMVLSLYLMLMAFSEAKTIQKRMFSTGNPFTFGGLRNAILHRQLHQHQEQPSESIVWPKFMALKEHIRPSRQNQPIVGSSAFIPVGNNLPLEVEHRAVDHHESAPHLNEVDVQSSTDSTPEPPTEAPIIFKQFTPSLPQPIPLPFAPYSIVQHTSVHPVPFTAFNGQVSQTSHLPQPTPVQTSLPTTFTSIIYKPEPVVQSSSQSFIPYNAPASQPISQSSFTPYINEQSTQQLPAPQPTSAVPAEITASSSNSELQSAPASFTPFNIPPPSQSFIPYQPAPQQLPVPHPTPVPAYFNPLSNPEPQSVRAQSFTPHNAPVHHHHQPAPQQYAPNNAHVQQPQPTPQQFTPYNAPVQQQQQPQPFIPHNAPVQQQQQPQPFIPHNAPVQQQSFTPYNAPAQQQQPAVQSYTPYNAPVQQPQPTPQPFTPHNAPVQQTRATPYSNEPVQQFQDSPFNTPSAPFTPYDAPQPQAEPPIQQSFQPADQAAPVESSRSYDASETQAYGPPQAVQPFSIFQEMLHENLVGWPGSDQPLQQQQGRQQPYQPHHEAHHQQDYRNSYANSRFLNFESPSSQFAKRSLESPPSPSELGFPSIGSFFDNFNNDVDWANFAGRRKRRSAQRTRSTHDWGNHKVIEDYDNIAVEARQSTESRVPAPSSRAVSNDRGHKQEPKQEYDGPYVYTQLFGPVSRANSIVSFFSKMRM